MHAKANLALIGPMGAGKSSIGRALAGLLARPFVDLDRCIEAHAGAAITLIFELEGEAGFRRRERQMLAEQLAGDGQVIACGGGIVLDPANRALLRERAFVVLIATSVDEQMERLARDRSRPLLQGADRREKLATLARERAPLYRASADLAFHAGHGGPAQAARALAALLSREVAAGVGASTADDGELAADDATHATAPAAAAPAAATGDAPVDDRQDGARA